MYAVMALLVRGSGPGEVAAVSAGLAVMAVLAGEDGQGGAYAELVAWAERHEQEAQRREREKGPWAFGFADKGLLRDATTRYTDACLVDEG